ncbi:MAG TPA: glycosyltransferase family 25 protein [Gaiellaceae bacterium]|nr:glycosyltransferase family 25 protein [Gaiellaceae bacterium]
MRVADLPVYVVHGRRLVERRERLSAALEAQGIAAEWVTEPDATRLTRDVRRRFYRKSRRAWSLRARETPKPSTPFRELAPVEVAATISHVEILDRIARSGQEWGLVFEDDAVLEDDFAERFDRCFADTPEDADVVFLGDAYGFRVAEPEPGRHFYRKDHPASKCTDSYLIRARAAEAIRSTIVPFTFPIDWELNYHFKLHDLVVYWLEPPLVTQGSFAGIYDSSIAYVRWRATLSPLFKARLGAGRVIRALPGGAAALRARREAAASLAGLARRAR